MLDLFGNHIVGFPTRRLILAVELGCKALKQPGRGVIMPYICVYEKFHVS